MKKLLLASAAALVLTASVANAQEVTGRVALDQALKEVLELQDQYEKLIQEQLDGVQQSETTPRPAPPEKTETTLCKSARLQLENLHAQELTDWDQVQEVRRATGSYIATCEVY